MDKISKPTSIVTSIGRTGTKFFAGLLAEVIPEATVFHEPDIFHLAEKRGHTVDELLSQIRVIGPYHLIIKKILGKWTLINVSDRRFSGIMEDAQAAQLLWRYRKKFVEKQKGNVYIESNAGYYGLIDIVDDVFQYQRIAYIVRDGRDWIRSSMNWGEMYHKGFLRKTFGHTWPTAKEKQDDPYADDWDNLERFTKLCWAWANLNKFALQTMINNPNARVFRFEDVFLSDERYTYLKKLLDFLLDYQDLFSITGYPIQGKLDNQIHKSSGDFQSWPNWSESQNYQFNEICGPVMKALGYY